VGIGLPDLLAFGFLLGAFVALVVVGRYWSRPLSPPSPLNLSLESLPYAFFFSFSRIALAYVICLFSSLAVGYWAAHSRIAEMIIVPLIDIGQSVPVLAFLPGLVLAFSAIFPESRIGLEIAAILTLYTAMTWNLMLAFYGSIKNIPREYVDTIRAYGYGPLGILLRLELPYSMNAIIWNSMMSVAGGWFFLTICESYTVGGKVFNLVGLGSYMANAADRGDYAAIVAGSATMVIALVVTNFFVWNPLLLWAERFQHSGKSGEDEDENQDSGDAVYNFFARSHRLTSLLRKMRRRYAMKFYVTQRRGRRQTRDRSQELRAAGFACLVLVGLTALLGTITALHMLASVPWADWLEIFRAAGWTLLRVTISVLASAVLMVPLGLWLGVDAKLVRKMQPAIQVIAGFPAPMIFPLFIVVFLKLHLPLAVGSVLLMMLCAQWYLLFNVLSGSANVPANLVEVARTSGMGTIDIIRRVYLPATFPQIVTGLITAAGGAWNGCIVAEYVIFRGRAFTTAGIGAYLTQRTQDAHYGQLMAAVTVMVLLILAVNRAFWARLYNLAESKYRLDE
jgi:NitT/TauT family transport system permease protein